MNIKIMTFSDHAPVTMKMKIEGAQNRINIWGLNKELLQDKEAEDRIKKELEQYFKTNDTDANCEKNSQRHDKLLL